MRLYRWGAGLANVGKDVVDDCGIGAGALKRAQGPLTTAAERAYGDIELERAFKALGPGQSREFGRLVLVWTARWVGRVMLVGAWLVRPAGHDPGP